VEVTGALTPAMRAATWVGGELTGAATTFTDNHREAQQNARLRQENRRLAAQLAELQAAEQENAQLRAELGLKRQGQVRTTAATVVARDPDGLERTLTIDAGSSSGVRAGMAVLAGSGLVGVVRSVTPGSAQVRTTSDPAFRVAVRTSTTSLGGVAQGGERELAVRLSVTGQTQPQPGEGVVTAGEGGTIPPGIAVGRLTTTTISGRTAGSVSGLITPFWDPAQVTSVLVVRSVRR
ncbi:MAG: rod shape-determining protein MreC, partial [Solirubrobacteraceae bacterium]